jgi:hypothetical protein
MSAAKEISRREFLALAAAASAALLAAQWPGAPMPWAHRHDLLIARLLGVFQHSESAGVVGQEYLRAYPDEANARRLTDTIGAAVPGGAAAILGASSAELRALLDRATRADFAAERVVTIQGWILSATEARLYALAALGS